QVWHGIRLSGISVRHDRTVQDATQHHVTMLLYLRSIGLETIEFVGFTATAQSALLVFKNVRGQRQIHANTCDEYATAELLKYLNIANSHGLSHRKITPQALVHMPDGKNIIIGWHNGDLASGSANIAVDRVQLLTLLSCYVGIEQAVNQAIAVWGKQTLIALVPFIQKSVIPAQTKELKAYQPQTLKDLRSYILDTIPEDAAEQVETVTLSRFSLRSFIAIVLAIVACFVILTQLQPNELIHAIRDAQPGMALLCLLCSAIAWAGSAITLWAFMTKNRDHYATLYEVQAASGFTAVSMPAGVGPALMNLQYLRKNGYRNTEATAIMSAVWAVQSITTVLFLIIIGMLSGRNMLSNMVPPNTLILAIGILAVLICLCMVVPPLRKMVVERILPIIQSYMQQFIEVITQPKELGIGVFGAVILNVAVSIGFWFSLLAFGYQSNPIETMFIFLLANAVGSAIPTPGGLGAVEAALTFGFTSVGVPAAIALSATLVYRTAFYWLRIPAGAVAMKILHKNNLI
ncbi:MAG: lysylphosphatidylglycerol synthase transmembrane domain-containing protein, partial [Bifidobacteriaceae bacterium]|nr:lysylphosphatidylglycerol synthase transmembrane domain-containing protein [Bifidobacteriaceae bacterium]